jgi:hypothetical protein
MRNLAKNYVLEQISTPATQIENVISSDTTSVDLAASAAPQIDSDSSTVDESIEQVDATAATDALVEIFAETAVETSEPAQVELVSASQDVTVSVVAADKKKSKPKPPAKKSNKTNSQKKVNPSKVETSS